MLFQHILILQFSIVDYAACQAVVMTDCISSWMACGTSRLPLFDTENEAIASTNC